ncbi:Protein FAM43A [Halotydeus destructor]|nr:Protein FAM43A [Halotydeus destructor]
MSSSILESLKSIAFWKKSSLTINDYDPVYKVIYLGNVLTPWAKGDACAEKPLATLWKNYLNNTKRQVYMSLTICNSGLKALTREHGLTEYWASRITFALAHPAHPRVFCWVYRHEGRKMKQELRCHAVLCTKESKAKEMAAILNSRLVCALSEFRREKRMRQNSKVTLASGCHSRTSHLPQRKRHLVKGQANFRAPLERSRSAPKLNSIDEQREDEEKELEEEDDAEVELYMRSLKIKYSMGGSLSSDGQDTNTDASEVAYSEGDSLSDALIDYKIG